KVAGCPGVQPFFIQNMLLNRSDLGLHGFSSACLEKTLQRMRRYGNTAFPGPQLYLHVKLVASSELPLPVKAATWGNGHNGRVRTVFSRRLVRGNNSIRNLSTLHPLCKRANAVEPIRSVAALAMIHSRDHEESNRIHGLGGSAERGRRVVVVLNGIHGRDAGV